MRCLQLHGGTDLAVLDPFAGTGTTLLAAHRLGHRGLGFELDPHYAAAAIARLKAETRAPDKPGEASARTQAAAALPAVV